MMLSLLHCYKVDRKWVWNPHSKGESSSAAAKFDCPSLLESKTNLKLKPSTTHKLHHRSRPVASNINELEQLALDVRAEKQLWKEAAQRAERKVVARKPTSGMASIPEGDIISQPIGEWSGSKASTGEGPFLPAHVSVLPCLAEQGREDREKATGAPTDRSSPEELLGEGCSDISDIVFADPSEIAEVEGTLLAPPLANMRSPLPFSLPASPPALDHSRPDSMHTLKEYPSISTMVFADRGDIELDPDVPEESVSATPRSRPTLRRVVRRIDFEECGVRRAVIVQTPSTPPHLDLNTTAAPQHLPFCFESFGYIASFLLGIPQPDLGSERPPSKSTSSEAHPMTLPSRRHSLLACETERARMEAQTINLTAQLNDAVEDIRDLLAQLHHIQDDMLLSKRETAARVEGFEMDIKVLNYEAQVAERSNKSLCAENEGLRLASLHNFTTGVHSKGGPSQYLGPSASIYSSPSSSLEGTPQLSSGTSSLPTTPCDRAAVSIAGGGNPIISEPSSTRSLKAAGTPAQPGCTVYIQDHGADELEHAYKDEEEEEELEGLDVDFGDMRQIPRLFNEMMLAEAERTLMLEEGQRPLYRGSSKKNEDETLLCLPMAEELQQHENPPPRKLYSSWREVAAEQDHLRQMRIE